MLPRLIVPLACAILLGGCASSGHQALESTSTAAPVTVGIIAINDFHGALDPPGQSVLAPDGKGGSVRVPAGGAAWLASAIDSVRSAYPNNLTVAAGDLISASQLSSSLYLDEPAIGVANRIGLEFNAVGNHEFDRGREELLRMQNGGCAQHTRAKPCAVEPIFTGARFAFMAASTRTEDGRTLFPATALKSFGSGSRKVTVGLIGLTLKGTTELVSPLAIKGLTFADEADTINAAVPALKAQGADAIVVLIHQGGGQNEVEGVAPDPTGCTDFGGPIRAILDRLSPGVDVVVSGHTHRSYVCDYGTLNPAEPILLTSAGVWGELVTDITLQIDPASNRVVSKRARNVIVQSIPYVGAAGQQATTPLYPQFAPRADVLGYVKRYTDAAARFALRPVGSLAGPAPKRSAGSEANTGGVLGNLLADAQLAATRGAGAQIALMNPFGIRASLIPAADGSLTFGDIYAVQPFANTMVTQTLTGAELKAVLEQNWKAAGPTQILSPSAGFTYRYDDTRPFGERIVEMTLDGKPIDPAARYRVTTNNFLANGGDGYSLLAPQRDAVLGGTDLEALEAWLKVTPARAVPMEDRTIATRRTASAPSADRTET